MQDFIFYAERHGIELLKAGSCQFCGAHVEGGVFECHGNAHRLSEVLNFNNPEHYETRFLSVDAMALQHCELHGPWNNHIHLTRLFLIFNCNISWDYSKTPQLSNIINKYKKDRSEWLTPPPQQQRGKITTSDIVKVVSVDETIVKVREWAAEVFYAFKPHHALVSSIAQMYMDRYYV
ncbi:hypothetical protein I5907_00090 [Panacibacter sp. DH6]|uniref:Uncharacterized protein n=1 Tax=Panacibacter microcysteis TaxID=2793269 RepID=A0A931E2Z2_9BACT|nr:DUF5946 family protein [Panacibacter microcysteis]MBG9374616.1 hypothetical protein [Panacibacter microcysteis]